MSKESLCLECPLPYCDERSKECLIRTETDYSKRHYEKMRREQPERLRAYWRATYYRRKQRKPLEIPYGRRAQNEEIKRAIIETLLAL